MSATIPCVPCCSTPQVTNVPGRTGDPGAAGTNGVNAFSLLTDAAFVTPAIGANVTTTVSSTQWMAVGQKVIIAEGQTILANPGPATFEVVTVNSITSVTLKFLHYTGDVGAATAIDSGATVSPAGVLSAFPTTTKGDLIVDDGATSPNPHPVRLAVGSNGQSVFADSGVADGVKWASGTQTMNVNTTSTATTGAGPEDLISYTIPASTLAKNGDSIEFEASFDIAANANNKTVEIQFGGTQVIHYGSVAQNGGNMILKGRVVRTGANAEMFFGTATVTNGAGTSASFSQDGTAAIATGAGIAIKGVGTNTAAADITMKSLVVKYCAS